MPATTARTVNDYDAAMCDRADEHGRPMLRMSQRVAGGSPDAFLFPRNGIPHLMDVAGASAGTPRPFTEADAMAVFGPTSELRL